MTNRRRSGLAVLAGCAIVLATGCTAQPTVQPAAPGPTQPTGATAAAAGPPRPSAEAVTGRAGVPVAACTAARLAGRTGNYEDSIQFVQFIVLTNTGTSTCRLSGGPAGVVGIERDGSRRLLSKGAVRAILASGWGNLTAPPATIAPGRSAQFALWMTGPCPFPARYAYTALTVGIGASGSVRVPLPAGLPSRLCGLLAASGFGTAIKT